MEVKITLKALLAAFKEITLILYAKIFGYYKDIDFLPIYKWDKISNGDYSYLYRFIRIKKTPRFFVRWFTELFYQFEEIEMSGFEDSLRLAYLKSLIVTAENKADKDQFINKYRSFKAKLEKKEAKKKKKKFLTLNDKTNFIEETFTSIGTINIHKMSTSRFYSLYYRALKKLENMNTKKE